jgi:hypothetical protein
MKFFLAILFSLLIFTSCKKGKIESITINSSRDSLNYQPIEPGSQWTYQRTVAGLGVTLYKFTRLNYDTNAYGKIFNVFSNEGDSYGNQYIRKDSGRYYNILVASTNKPALLVLDTAKNINESWVGGVNGSDTYTYTMKQKLATYSLDDFVFRNVLVVHAERTTTSGSSTLSGDTYYAQGIGQVLTQGTVNGINVEVRLKIANLK